MEVLIDTNIVLDWLLKRGPYLVQAEEVMKCCTNGKAKGYLACHTLTNIFYILRKDFSAAERKDIIMLLCNTFEIIGIDKQAIVNSLSHLDFKDLEDSLQIECAISGKLDYIVTRNTGDFTVSAVKAISPMEFTEVIMGRH